MAAKIGTNWILSINWNYAIRRSVVGVFFFKRDGILHGITEDQITGNHAFLDIELINNCTTTRGFEIRLKNNNGTTFHGSIKTNTQFDKLYKTLSQHQAGTLARQEDGKICQNSNLTFGWDKKSSIYGNFREWGPKKGHAQEQFTIDIDLDRYRSHAYIQSENELWVEMNKGKINYKRWGDDTEYYQKPLLRRLIHTFRLSSSNRDSQPPSPPLYYTEIRDAEDIKVPNLV